MAERETAWRSMRHVIFANDPQNACLVLDSTWVMVTPTTWSNQNLRRPIGPWNDGTGRHHWQTSFCIFSIETWEVQQSTFAGEGKGPLSCLLAMACQHSCSTKLKNIQQIKQWFIHETMRHVKMMMVDMLLTHAWPEKYSLPLRSRLGYLPESNGHKCLPSPSVLMLMHHKRPDVISYIVILIRALLSSGTGLRKSNTVIRYLVLSVIQIGVLASLWAIGGLVTWFFLPKRSIYTCFNLTAGSMYTNVSGSLKIVLRSTIMAPRWYMTPFCLASNCASAWLKY